VSAWPDHITTGIGVGFAGPVWQNRAIARPGESALQDLIAYRDPLIVLPGVILWAVFHLQYRVDPQRDHCLFWGTGFLIGALAYLLIPFDGVTEAMRGPPQLAAGLVSFTGLMFLLYGVFRYIGYRPRPLQLVLGTVLALAGGAALTRWSLLGSTLYFDLITLAVYLAMAAALWRGGVAERVAAVLFISRALNFVVWTQLVAGYEFHLRAEITQFQVLGAGIALLFASFLSSNAELLRVNRMMTLVERLSYRLSGMTDPRRIYEEVADVLHKETGARGVALYELDRSAGLLRLQACRGWDEREHPVLREFSTAARLAGQLAKSRSPRSVSRLEAADPELVREAVSSVLFSEGVNTLGIFPIAYSQRVIGFGGLGLADARPLAERELSALEAVGRATGFALTGAEQRARARHAAAHDLTTGLANRTRLHDEYELRRDQDGLERGATLLLVDIARLREINQRYGHYFGDQLLAALAARLAAIWPDEDKLVARSSGVQFAVILFGSSDEAAAQDRAATLLDTVTKPIELDGRRAELGARLGIALAPDRGLDDRELLRRAELAMYAATESEPVRLYSPELDVPGSEAKAVASGTDT
jgi:diguanylate cyclase (GGDEF)-like protein